MGKNLELTWVKSSIGYPRQQRKVLSSLGFKRLNQTLVKKDCPEIRGMVNKVSHLLRVREID